MATVESLAEIVDEQMEIAMRALMKVSGNMRAMVDLGPSAESELDDFCRGLLAIQASTLVMRGGVAHAKAAWAEGRDAGPFAWNQDNN